jgi:hypothetical protein
LQRRNASERVLIYLLSLYNLSYRKVKVNFTNLLAQSANAPVVIFWRQQSFFCTSQFHQQNYTQLYHYKQQENTLNFYAVRKLGINLLAQMRPEAVFLVSLRTRLFPAGNEVYGKSIESSFLPGNELAPSSFLA